MSCGVYSMPLRWRPSARSISRSRVALGDGLALVALLAALGQAQLDLGPAVPEVQAQRDERQALLGDAGLQAVDLVAVQQQLAAAVGVVGADPVGELVRGDVHALQPQLAVGPAGEGVGQLHLAEAQALDLAALQHEAGLDGVEHGVVVARPAVAGDRRACRRGTADRALMGRSG